LLKCFAELKKYLLLQSRNAKAGFWELKYWNYAKVAQLVERDLAKVEVAGSNPVFRSKRLLLLIERLFFRMLSAMLSSPAQVVELVDTQDLKSCVHCERIGSSPIPGTSLKPLLNKDFR
jgi:hypothetical protein